MPGNLLAADTGFPTLNQGQSTEEKIEKITSYLFMLLEQLRYSMGNLDKGNFNEAGLEEIAHIITAPVYVQLKDAEGNIANIQADAKVLSSRMSDAEGGLSSLVQTVNGMTLTVSQAGKSSKISLNANGAEISSGTINLSGMVTFNDLEGSGTTTINGAYINTGTINAVDIEGSTFKANMVGESGSGEVEFYYRGSRAGRIRLDAEGAGDEENDTYRMFIEAETAYGKPFSMKLKSAQGISLEAASNMYIRAEDLLELRGATIMKLSANSEVSMGVKVGNTAYGYIDIEGDMVKIEGGTINLVGDVRVNGSSIG